MGFYSFGGIKIVSRNRGKSAAATAAYHTGTKITNEFDGVTHDYTRKQHVGETYVRLPENAPAELRDESIPAKERAAKLWNKAEMHDLSLNAQLARQNYISLPHDLPRKDAMECLERFVKENCTDQGMGCTFTIHEQPGNLHADMMYLMREFDRNGEFRNKSRKQYLCRDEGGKNLFLFADEVKKEKYSNFEKVYKYRRGNTWKELTATEAAKPENAGFKRTSKYPIDRKICTNTWNDQDLAKKWRKSWEMILNDKYKELGMPDRVDCRSNEERGLAAIPTLKVGYGPDAPAKKALNGEIIAFNAELLDLQEEAEQILSDVEQQIDDFKKPQTAASLEAQRMRTQHYFNEMKQLCNSGLLDQDAVSVFTKRWHELLEQIKRLYAKHMQALKSRNTQNKGYTAAEHIAKDVKKDAQPALKNLADQVKSVPIDVSPAKAAVKGTKSALDSLINNAVKRGGKAIQTASVSDMNKTNAIRNAREPDELQH